MKKLIAMLTIVGMLSGCGVFDRIANPRLTSTTPPKPAKKYKVSDIGMATGGVILIGGSIMYVVVPAIWNLLTLPFKTGNGG